MFEKALKGSGRYWAWLAVLAGVIGVGVGFWFMQFHRGLTITGLSRDVAWGFYIAQFTFLVGVAASAVMVVLPYYLHDFKVFGKVTILGEFLAISAVTMCMLFIFVDMGQPFRILNVFLHPTPHSLMFWDTVSLFGYLVLNAVIAYVTLDAERMGVAPRRWIRPVIILSIPWAISIHTVTAMLYSGLAGRPFWLSAVLAPRFLASAFSSGPALLILLVLLLRRVTRFDAGTEPVRKLAVIVTYAMCINVFFILMEFFTAFYSGIPGHAEHFRYLLGIGEHSRLAPWMWASYLLAAVSLVLLINPKTRNNLRLLPWTCVLVFASIWIDKGLGMVVTGFIPSPLGEIVEYSPTFPELMISVGVYAIGALLITLFYKITVGVRESIA
ncbi:MAG TPA: menaquinol oxidoreductase [Bacteroidetes bacterium]|nr:menaquinol oxidoreductase [Bacteroidota bacterium]